MTVAGQDIRQLADFRRRGSRRGIEFAGVNRRLMLTVTSRGMRSGCTAPTGSPRPSRTPWPSARSWRRSSSTPARRAAGRRAGRRGCRPAGSAAVRSGRGPTTTALRSPPAAGSRPASWSSTRPPNDAEPGEAVGCPAQASIADHEACVDALPAIARNDAPMFVKGSFPSS